MAASTTVRTRLEAQGFCGLDDATMGELAPWLRWSPTLCTLVMILGVVMQSPAVLYSLAAIALLGALLPFHLFDLIYNYGVRHLTGTRPLPNHGPQRRFACALAAAWLLGTGWAFQAGLAMIGYSLGVPLILAAGLVSVTHFCIPSFVYNTIFSRTRSKSA